MIYAASPRVYLSPVGRLAYFHAPKCASRTILGWLTLAKVPGLKESDPHLFDPFALGDYPRFSLEIQEATPKDSYGRTKFCVVRDPIERFVSAYCDRVLRYGRKELESFPTISSLVQSLHSLEDFASLKHHVRPLVDFYGVEPQRYEQVFRFCEIAKLKNFLEERMNQKLPDLRLQSCEKIEKPTLTDEDRAILQGFYAEDYKVFHEYLA